MRRVSVCDVTSLLKNLRDVAKRYDVLRNVVFRDASLYNLFFKLKTEKCFSVKVSIVNVKKGISFKTCPLKLFCLKNKEFLNFFCFCFETRILLWFCRLDDAKTFKLKSSFCVI